MEPNWEGRGLLDEIDGLYREVDIARTVDRHLATYASHLDKEGDDSEPSDMLGCWDGVLRLIIGAKRRYGEFYTHAFESRHIRADEGSLAADIARECDGLRGQELLNRLGPLLGEHAARILAAMRADETPYYYYELNGRVVHESPRGGHVVDPLRGEGDRAADCEMADLRLKGEGELEFLPFAEARARLEREGADVGELFFREDDAVSAFVARGEFGLASKGARGSDGDPQEEGASIPAGEPVAPGRTGTFCLEDITEELLARVVYYHFGHPSPHIDSAGFIEFLTDDGQLYAIDCGRRGDGFERPYRDWHEVFPVIDETGACGRWSFTDDKRAEVYGSPSSGEHYVVGDWGVAYFGGDHLVRRDLYPRFLAELERRGRAFCRESAVVALGLDPGGCLARRLVYAKSLEALEREEREREELREHWERVRLEPCDLEWTEVRHRSDDPDGDGGFRACYTLLYKENSLGNLFATMWTIVAQLDTDMFDGPESRPDLFNVYHRRWHQAKGAVHVGTRHDGAPADMGDFVRTCRTLAEAKELVTRRNDEGMGWGGYSKENLVDPVTRQPVFGLAGGTRKAAT